MKKALIAIILLVASMTMFAQQIEEVYGNWNVVTTVDEMTDEATSLIFSSDPDAAFGIGLYFKVVNGIVTECGLFLIDGKTFGNQKTYQVTIRIDKTATVTDTWKMTGGQTILVYPGTDFTKFIDALKAGEVFIFRITYMDKSYLTFRVYLDGFEEAINAAINYGVVTEVTE